MKTELQKLCDAKSIKISYKDGAPRNPEFLDCFSWTITLRYQGRRLTVPFYRRGSVAPPDSADVLLCLLADATGYESASSFEDWCSEFGYDSDSRKAERIYKKCERLVLKVHRFLGDDFDTFANVANAQY